MSMKDNHNTGGNDQQGFNNFTPKNKYSAGPSSCMAKMKSCG